MSRVSRFVIVIAAAISVANTAEAQRLARPRHATVTAAAGLSQWDLSGTGSSVILAVRVDRQLGPQWLLGEASLATFRPQEQGGDSRYIIPEAHLQLQVPRTIAPYVGAGIGAFTRVSGGPGSDSELTTSAAVGLRLWGVIPRGLLRGELRLRGIGRSFTGSAAEWTGGLGWSF